MKLAAMVVIALVVALAGPAQAIDVKACEPAVTLPSAIARVLRADYKDWRMVTAKRFTADEAKEWKGGCPGAISARLRGRRLDYVVDLTRGREVRVIAFLAGAAGYRKRMLVSAKDAHHLELLLKGGPGVYQSAEGDRTVKVATDAVCVAAMWVGSICYFWKAGKFQSIIVSE